MSDGALAANLAQGFVRASAAAPKSSALFVEGRTYTYEEVDGLAASVATLLVEGGRGDASIVAVFAHRSVAAYASILGVLAAGRGYAPLNPDFPAHKTSRMLALSGASTVVVGPECVEQAEEVLRDLASPVDVVAFTPEVAERLGKVLPRHRVLERAPVDARLDAPDVAPGAVAYLLFTSGSTGVPKGVPVKHRNANPYVDFICRTYGLAGRGGRFSQMFDLTFDLSAHDMFVCWAARGCLMVVPGAQLLGPARFIREHEITHWFSVPSAAASMAQMRMLKPGAFPSLELSLFCGEALSVSVCRKWQAAAPNSRVENLYGPTEATIAITRYTWRGGASEADSVNGLVPIGVPFDGHACAIVDDALRPVPPGGTGELCLTGPQVASGYLNDPEKTRERFVQLPHEPGHVWYRTGDMVLLNPAGQLCYLGRVDDQVKIQGFRVELSEIDNVLREAAGTALAVSVAWPRTEGIARGVVGFVVEPTRPQPDILAACRAKLPPYMVPRRLIEVEKMPLNANGKIDRKALVGLHLDRGGG